MARLEQLIRGYQFTQALYVAVDLSIPELVADGPQDVAVLAASCGAHPASLARLLRALTAVGVFAEVAPGVFGATSLSDALRDGVDGSRRATLMMNAVDLYTTWGELGHSVRTGQTATSLVYGMDSWTWRSLHPEQGARFDAAMSERSRQRMEAFVASYDMAPFRTVVDVGGGQGALLVGDPRRLSDRTGRLVRPAARRRRRGGPAGIDRGRRPDRRRGRRLLRRGSRRW